MPHLRFEAHALAYAFTDLDVPGSQPVSTGTFDALTINNLGQIVGSYATGPKFQTALFIPVESMSPSNAPGACSYELV